MSKPEAPARPDSYRSVLGAVVAFFLLLIAVAGINSFRDLAAARERERMLESKIEQTEERIDRLRGRIERLRSDPATLERLAREELGLVRPADVVIVLPEPGRAPAPLPPPPSPPPAEVVPVAAPAAEPAQPLPSVAVPEPAPAAVAPAAAPPH